MDSTCITKTDYKKTVRYKGTSQAPNLYTYRDKNKDRSHTINRREMLQTSDKSTKKPQLQVRFWLLKQRGSHFPQSSTTELNFLEKITHNTFRSYPANNQKNIL